MNIVFDTCNLHIFIIWNVAKMKQDRENLWGIAQSFPWDFHETPSDGNPVRKILSVIYWKSFPTDFHGIWPRWFSDGYASSNLDGKVSVSNFSTPFSWEILTEFLLEIRHIYVRFPTDLKFPSKLFPRDEFPPKSNGIC